MPFEKILVVDDELIIRKSLQTQLQRKKYVVAAVETMSKAREYLNKDSFDFVLLDIRLPDGDGTDLLKEMANIPDGPIIVMMTGYGSVGNAVECMRLGAFDYIIKPFTANQIEVVLKKAEDYSHLVKVNRFLARGDMEDTELLGDSRPMKDLKKLIQRVAPTEATVLIQGESGTGKEVIATEIHRYSNRSQAPFIRVNCAAISETLIESEFFGHEKGAFTGAASRREGRFELANGGTILLDEISEISPSLQAKLLRVLQEKEFERVGGNVTIKVDARVIATTNRDLSKAVSDGKFREDLYYRLNVFPIINPPLRERKEDIPMLAEYFLKRLSRKHGIKPAGFQEDALIALMEHDWPGNVRELQNTIERAVILTEDNEMVTEHTLGLYHTLTNSRKGTPRDGREQEHRGDTVIEPLNEVEKREILRALKITDGNRTKAAEALNITARTLRNKLNQYKLEGVEIPEV